MVCMKVRLLPSLDQFTYVCLFNTYSESSLPLGAFISLLCRLDDPISCDAHLLKKLPQLIKLGLLSIATVANVY